jgi:hypothetical protein
MVEEVLVNRVDNSGLITIDLEKFYPSKTLTTFDIKDYLFHGLILKEKDFREALKVHDWSQYNDTVLCIICSNDSIIPVWAYMLIATYATGFASEVYVGNHDEYVKQVFQGTINQLNIEDFVDQKVVIKGCSNKPVPPSAYAAITSKLAGKAQSIMYGEPCSTVPVYKKPKLKP